MPRLPLRAIALLLLPVLAGAQEVQRFRQWIDGAECGGLEVVTSRRGGTERIEHREWTQLTRLGSTLHQELSQTATRSPKGAVALTWKITLSTEPMLGEASWTPEAPGILRVELKGGKPASLPVPPGGVVWPGDSEAELKEAARAVRPIHLVEFEGATQQWTHLDLQPVGPEPLPGFGDAVHFRGEGQEGRMSRPLDLWISPRHGEVKQLTQLGGLTVLVQRAELPPPSDLPAASSYFDRTLIALPPHPFLPWLPEAILRWDGAGPQELPQDPQQIPLGAHRYQVKRAALPDALEAAELPLTGTPAPEDAPFLAPTPLVQFQDPVFDGLLARLNPPKGASRWELARRVTTFVFDWISQKDMSVGFASAQEAARTGKGDCTGHGVLAVALLRRLGVPARGVVGWAALDEVLGLHFWVEVQLRGRWVPIDPTFDQAPASAVRLKLATADLADLGSIGWDTRALSFVDGTWVPEKPWAEAIRLGGETVLAPDGLRLRLPGARWSLKAGTLEWTGHSRHASKAVIHPSNQQREGAKLLRGARSGRRGWWSPGAGLLWVELGEGRWLQVDNMTEPDCFSFLDTLEIQP